MTNRGKAAKLLQYEYKELHTLYQVLSQNNLLLCVIVCSYSILQSIHLYKNIIKKRLYRMSFWGFRGWEARTHLISFYSQSFYLIKLQLLIMLLQFESSCNLIILFYNVIDTKCPMNSYMHQNGFLFQLLVNKSYFLYY